MESVVFLSPHYDDVVLSCSGLLQRMANQGQDVVVVSVFTKNQPERERENQQALSVLGIRGVSLDLPDAPEREVIKQRGGRILFGNPDEDPETLELLVRLLRQLKVKGKVYAPLGIGWHLDHLLVHEAALRVFPENVLFYEDVPYKWVRAQASLRLGDISPGRIAEFCEEFPRAHYVRSFLPHWKKSDFLPLLETQLRSMHPSFRLLDTIHPREEEMNLGSQAIEKYASQIEFLYPSRADLIEHLRPGERYFFSDDVDH